MTKPRLAVTMGDPAGVGPEICLRLLNDDAIAQECVPVIFGDAAVLRKAAQVLGMAEPRNVVPKAEWDSAYATLAEPSVLDLEALDLTQFSPGTISAETGAAAYAYVDAAITAALAGQIAGVVTAPLNKEALAMAGIKFPGHTEIFASRTHAPRSCMMQYSEEITCTFVTVHVGYHEVPQLITPERILDVIELTADALLRIRGRTPKLLVCGLNPHAGEHGLFGEREEERFIVPAVEAARAKGLHVDGPVPPDTAFIPQRRREYDAVVCMYHDQGHIPVKMLVFDSAVNTTLGLPIIRTSVDHGTALDIAWQGKASPGSMFSAVRLAVKLAPEGGKETSPGSSAAKPWE
ncbi:4-hydroxythreonine-4-phosphate dehydrogenase PdxA [Verrucomicrobiota bacterium sgz303538]